VAVCSAISVDRESRSDSFSRSRASSAASASFCCWISARVASSSAVRSAAGEAARLPLQVGPQPLQPRGLRPQPVLLGPGQPHLLFQFDDVPPQLLEPIVYLDRAPVKRKLPVRERSLPAVEPDHVTGVAVAVSLERVPVEL